MSIAIPASTHPSLGSSPHRHPSPGSSALTYSPKDNTGLRAVRFAPYSASSSARSLSRSRSPHNRSGNGQHLEVQLRSSKSPSPSALSAGSHDSYAVSGKEGSPLAWDDGEWQDREESRQVNGLISDSEFGSPSPVPRDSISTVSDVDSEVSAGPESAMNRLALGIRPQPILKPTARRAKPPGPLRSTHARGHQRAHSFSSTSTKPVSVGYMLCPSPRSATFGRSQRELQAQAQGVRSPLRASFPTVSVPRSAVASPDLAPAPIHAHGVTALHSPRSPRASRPVGLDTIVEADHSLSPVTPASASMDVDAPAAETVLPSRRHSTYAPAMASLQPTSDVGSIRRTPSPSNGATETGAIALQRMMLVNPAIAAHLKRGGVVSVRSVDGKRSWKIRMTPEQLAALRMK